jgi:hypothetical protein
VEGGAGLQSKTAAWQAAERCFSGPVDAVRHWLRSLASRDFAGGPGRPRGLKPTGVLPLDAALEAPLFHGTTGFRGEAGV